MTYQTTTRTVMNPLLTSAAISVTGPACLTARTHIQPTKPTNPRVTTAIIVLITVSGWRRPVTQPTLVALNPDAANATLPSGLVVRPPLYEQETRTFFEAFIKMLYDAGDVLERDEYAAFGGCFCLHCFLLFQLYHGEKVGHPALLRRKPRNSPRFFRAWANAFAARLRLGAVNLSRCAVCQLSMTLSMVGRWYVFQ